MWNRSELKEKAKGKLKGFYWQAFFVSFILVITGGSHNKLDLGSSGSTTGTTGGGEFGLEIAFIAVLGIFIFLALRIFLGYILEVGGRRYFIELSRGGSQISYLLKYFDKKYYKNIIIALLFRGIYIFLWSLLLIIPGIIKMYQYRFVPYIMAENPELDHNKALNFSREMTAGEKMDIFILDLSFLGWFILGALFFGIGILFVQPYYDAVNAELYQKLKAKS
ncbi:uncharacterized protein DUF975 [Halanaerobium saccharolyticum]|uniref:Uncharacterized protein DUF975 n=1 Tax=Halanaerobium saccharolyticum TaxID=43595 RepID=A0A4V3G432_9FIRM|nr:DUF975 family protein [Halanaerobium saccharolyticum]RAK05041.1 uncharacterized protein DUF975 [Halanaerobium saccharolyticum]TDV98827.1 uncharacterized protein DUF975 [Halanaerobium saccharolyticum]TDX51478.1 uncharacterized protein DUF975 [Halanaerobium saccharolyticum]